ncbi:MAG: hypothetical protein Q7R41_08220 [Phycisphaerales bacterium]|nr:hypothetical protein [Phycisphaerales bacterium]
MSNLSAFSGSDKTEIRIERAYDGNIGDDGSPLLVGVKYLAHYGTGTLVASLEDHASWSTVVIESPNQQDAFVLTGSAAALLDLHFIDGGVSLQGATTVIDNMNVGGRGMLYNPQVTIASSVGDVSRYYQDSGIVTTERPLGVTGGACLLNGGLLIYDMSATTSWPRITIAGGTYRHNANATLSRAVVCAGGVLDMTGDSRAKTISGLTLKPGATFLTHRNITVSSLTDLREAGNPILP